MSGAGIGSDAYRGVVSRDGLIISIFLFLAFEISRNASSSSSSSLRRSITDTNCRANPSRTLTLWFDYRENLVKKILLELNDALNSSERGKINEDERGMEFIPWKIGSVEIEGRSSYFFFLFYKDFTKPKIVLSRKMIEAFLRYIYEPRKRRKKKEEMHRAMNSPLEPTFFFFNRPSIAKDETHALHGIPAQAAGASSVCSNERRKGEGRRCRRRRRRRRDKSRGRSHRCTLSN